MNKKICVALSGGIDSIIAGWLLKEEGFDLTGIHLTLVKDDKSCLNARLGAEFLDIPFIGLDLATEFQKRIIEPFVSAYFSGYTPNPCVFCNAIIKCGLLLERIIKDGFHYLATGHYAQIEHDVNKGRFLLVRGIDNIKDQSYFLYRLKQEQLSRLLFPLGKLKKKEVIDIASRIGLKADIFRESQEICFLPSNDYRLLLKKVSSRPFAPGPVYDMAGNMLGTHSGLPNYTIGQRKGLQLSRPGPYYILALDSKKNSVIVGSDDDLWGSELIAHQVSRIIRPWPKKNILAQIRSTQPAQKMDLEELCDGRIRIRFHEPVRAITPGQSVVLYDGGTCIGGGIIEALTSLFTGSSSLMGR